MEEKHIFISNKELKLSDFIAEKVIYIYKIEIDLEFKANLSNIRITKKLNNSSSSFMLNLLKYYHSNLVIKNSIILKIEPVLELKECDLISLKIETEHNTKYKVYYSETNPFEKEIYEINIIKYTDIDKYVYKLDNQSRILIQNKYPNVNPAIFTSKQNDEFDYNINFDNFFNEMLKLVTGLDDIALKKIKNIKVKDFETGKIIWQKK